MNTRLHKRSLSGWGKTNPSVADFAQVDRDDLRNLLQSAQSRGIVVRGLGRSYGDAAQNGGGLVVHLSKDEPEIDLDVEARSVRCTAGVSLDDLIAYLVPRGFFVPVTPGTRFVTVGGAIASDIHGKNHHVDGSFGSHVSRMSMLLADGRVQEVSPENDRELFWASVGGMGLTGAILDASFAVFPIETSRCRVDTHRCANLDELIDVMSHGDERVKYSVAWTDLLAKGRSLGRSILWRGEHARLSELPDSTADPLEYSARQRASIPPVIPAPGCVNKYTARLFNELWFRSAPSHRTGEIKTIPSYFHPLDSIGSWNRLYGPGGFIQYQFVVPFGAEDVLREVVSTISHAELASPLVVLKRFGRSNDGFLSFPTEGWTLTVDIPARSDNLPALLSRLDGLVIGAGGRHYLAKDAHMTPETFAKGYPLLDQWLEVKRRVDPTGVWTSDLARRLELI